MSHLMISDRADILLLDDQSENLHLLVHLLTPEFNVHPFTDPDEMMKYLTQGRAADLILLDVIMPKRDGYEVCRWIRGHKHLEHIPIIFLTSLDSSEDERKGLALGADDYISKPFSAPIVQARVRHQVDLGRSLRIIADQNDNLDTKVRERTVELELHAHHDSLTQLLNRRRLESTLGALLDAGQHGALLLISLHRLQPVVESLGYHFADRVLIALSQRLSGLVSSGFPQCTLYRFEGALFAILAPIEVNAPAMLAELIERIEIGLRAPLQIENERSMYFPSSIGLTSFPKHGNSVGVLLRNANTARQEAEWAGTGTALVYQSEMSEKRIRRTELEYALRDAIALDQLVVHYQAQVDIAGLKIIGVEALVRWNHPEKGTISPADFIPVAEESGFITEIGTWVLETACTQNRQWQMQGHPPIVMAVNVSPRQFSDPALLGHVKQVLQTSGLAPQWLELEITEGAVIHDIKKAVGIMHDLKKMGVGLAVDDFGTGFSSLSYLATFPIDKLKIDQSFIRNLTNTKRDKEIVRTIVNLGNALGLTLIAEGVEKETERKMLAELGCHQFQGFFFSRPCRATELSSLLLQSATQENLRTGEYQ